MKDKSFWDLFKMKDWGLIGIKLGLFLLLSLDLGNALKCNVCDLQAKEGFREANTECLAKGVQKCGPKDTACMMETYIAKNGDNVGHRVLKYCVEQCPIFINNTAILVRCCKEDGCNKDLEPKRPPPIFFNNSNGLKPSLTGWGLTIDLLLVHLGVVLATRTICDHLSIDRR